MLYKILLLNKTESQTDQKVASLSKKAYQMCHKITNACKVFHKVFQFVKKTKIFLIKNAHPANWKKVLI